jgi:uncharacterized protein (DUF58 family)
VNFGGTSALSSDEAARYRIREILRKVRRIEIRTGSLVNTLFAGGYQAVFKGSGIEFTELRTYQPGDDTRRIDWNVTARIGHPFVKLFREERELTVMLLVDVSRSGEFGTGRQMKGDIAVEICASLAFSALRNNDRVGLLTFDDRVRLFIPPRKGRNHILRIIRELLVAFDEAFSPEGEGWRTDINVGLEHWSRIATKRSVTFLVSDFLASPDYETALRIVSRKHDLIAIVVNDPREMGLPPIGIVVLEDAETGESLFFDTSDSIARERFTAMRQEEVERRRRLFRTIGVDAIEVSTDTSYTEPLMRFFKTREKRFR